MKALTMLLAFFLSACAGPKVSLLLYSDESRREVKPEYYDVSIFSAEPKNLYNTIGEVKVWQEVGHKPESIIEELKKGCREMGGDALMGIERLYTDAANPLMPVVWSAKVIIFVDLSK